MEAFKKPVVPLVGAVLLLVLLASIEWGLANSFKVILTAILAFFTALFLHEAGHLAGGLLTRSRFLKMAIGPFVLERNEAGKLSFHFNGTWSEAGGLVLMQLEDPHFKKKVLLYNAGGPLSSLLFAALYINEAQYFQLTGFFSLVLFATTILPYNMSGLFSDGYTLLKVMKNDENFLRYYKMTNMLLSTKKPETWNLSIQQEAASMNSAKLTMNELSIYLMFLFYSAVITGSTSYLQKFYSNLDLKRIDQANTVQQASILHYVVAAEFLLGKSFSITKEKFNELPPIDMLSKLRTRSIFEKAAGHTSGNTNLYQQYLENKSSESYSFLDVESRFLHQYLL